VVTNKVLLGASFFTIFLFVIILLIFIYLVIRRRYMERKEQKILEYIEHSKLDWFNYLIKGEVLEQQKHNKYLNEAVDKIFLSYNLTIKDEQMNNRLTSYAELNMRNYYEKQLSAKDWAVRVNVLHRIVLFNLHFLVPAVMNKLKMGEFRTKEEYMIMLRIASIYDENLFLAHVMKPKMKLYEYDYKMILSQINDLYHRKIMDNFDGFSINMKLAFLDYLSYQTSLNEQSLLFFESILQSVHKEFRIKALKAINSFGMVSSLEPYYRFAMSEEWEERLMVSKILRLVSSDEVYAMLNTLICDRNWYVRKQAAETLKGKKDGEERLVKIVNQQEDRFAADMAKEVLIMR